MAIVPLYLSRDRLVLETHFAALDSEDLRFRFCGSIKPAGVIHYLNQLTAAQSFGIINSNCALVAVCQLAQSAGDLRWESVYLRLFDARDLPWPYLTTQRDTLGRAGSRP